jgi:hypothetical protein
VGHTLYFEQPKLRSNVKITHDENCIHIRHHGTEVELAPLNNISLRDIENFLNVMDGNHSIDEIVNSTKIFSRDDVINYIKNLDDNWLLSEGKKNRLNGKTGLEFIIELEDKYAQWLYEAKETPLTRLLLDNKASKNLVIGFSFEYYHVTRRCHECISPAIAKAQGEIREKVIEFFVEEYRHDKLLAKSLMALGYTKNEIENSIPLPYTQSIMNMLSKWAHTDLLSLMAGIFIFEGTDYDGYAYKDAISAYDFPPDFAKYQNTHGDINLEGDHGHVTREFFTHVGYISPEDQTRVINNIRFLNELHVRMHANTIDYYDHPNSIIPRSLDSLIK